MKKLMILLIIAALVCVTFTAMAAGDGIAFEKNAEAINEGETLQTVLTRMGEAESGEVTYTSSNPKMATVDENGLVTAVLKGRVVITAAVKGAKKTYKAQLKLTILRPATSVTVKTDKLPIFAATDEKVASLLTARENAEENELPVLLLPVKKRYQIRAESEPRDASDRKVVFSSSDEAVFAAAKNTVTGVAPGEGILTIASESNPDVTARYRVLVIQPVTKLAIEASAPQVVVGEQVTVTAKATPENATIQEVTWSSGDKRTAEVDESGTVTGIKRGRGRIIATATDGSNVRANLSLKVVQNPEKVTLASEEITVDLGRKVGCRATVEPRNTDNKKLIWTSSDESIASVDKSGRITGNSVGECTITCTCEALESVKASLTVHVQKPVKKLTFNDKNAYAYLGETTQLGWTIQPEDATNQGLTFKSARESIATVDENGLVTGVTSGKTTITAMTTDGSRRKASITVHTGRHVSGVEMSRKHAYIDKGESVTVSANIEPKDALNKNMSWESSDPGVARAGGSQNKVKITGASYGNTVVTGTTEDGGYQAYIRVTVDDFDRGLSFRNYDYDRNGNTWLSVKNNTDFTITQITAEMELWDCSGEELEPAVINRKTHSNKVDIVWNGRLAPGESTGKQKWKMVNFMTPSCGMDMTRGQITIYSYNIEGEWLKTIRKFNRPYKYWD